MSFTGNYNVRITHFVLHRFHVVYNLKWWHGISRGQATPVPPLATTQVVINVLDLNAIGLRIMATMQVSNYIRNIYYEIS